MAGLETVSYRLRCFGATRRIQTCFLDSRTSINNTGTKETTIMVETNYKKVFECIVCLDVVKECVNCTQCNQILCKSHTKELSGSRSRCPGCRDTPFRFQENVALQRIVEQIDTSEEGNEQHAGERVSGEDQQPAASRSIPPIFDEEGTFSRPPRDPEGIVSRSTVVAPEYGTKVPRNSPNQDQYKKIPNAHHKATMTAHISSCEHGGCLAVWRGPWGHFIGGRKGTTHFDLTGCPDGRQMNERIGWDYENPPY